MLACGVGSTLSREPTTWAQSEPFCALSDVPTPMGLPTQPAIRSKAAVPLLGIVLVLQLLHALTLALLPHPLVLSNLLQLLCGVTTAAVCFAQLPFVSERAGRRCWAAVATAFSIWSAAQAVYLFLLRFPPAKLGAVRPDDLLWTLFGLPLLLAVNTFTEESADRVLWLDRLQGILFFVVLYLVTFLPGVQLSTEMSFLVQDVALILACFLRLPTAATDRERRFFVRLASFLSVYAPMSVAGDELHRRGYPQGSAVDLVWTIPLTFFSCLVLSHAIRPWSFGGRSRMVSSLRNMQGLGAALLALLSIGLSIYLAVRAPLPGGICITLAFGLFALRTNAREVAWYTAHGQLKETVLQDPLTGLGNRLLLQSRLAERLNDDAENAVLLFLDLDQFKSINDNLGHALGDRFLIEVGRRLCAAAPPDSVVCRIGGDEFVVLGSADTIEEAERTANHLLKELHAPLRVGAHELRCSASIGVVLASAGEEPDDLLRTADHAMYRAKELGKNRVQIFDAALRAQMSHRWQIETDLRACVAADAIDVAFQPIYSVEQSDICGFEALARWCHPRHGNIAPNVFIPIAEESGLILRLGAQIFEKACSQIAAWNRAWGTALSLSVNVSPRQFADPGLMPSLLAILDRTGLPPSLVRLEITETALLTHVSIVKQTLEQAHQHGIRISLDDFGTGYSSLSFLLSLPVDEVKVDRSFVSNMHEDPDREELVRTVIHLGRSLGKRVVAEGVETERDLQDLTAMGCECMQGFLISRPLSAQAIEADLAAIALRGRGAGRHRSEAIESDSAAAYAMPHADTVQVLA